MSLREKGVMRAMWWYETRIKCRRKTKGRVNVPFHPCSWCLLLYTASHCPPKFIGMDIIWIVVVSLLATYNITKAIDENGH